MFFDSTKPVVPNFGTSANDQCRCLNAAVWMIVRSIANYCVFFFFFECVQLVFIIFFKYLFCFINFFSTIPVVWTIFDFKFFFCLNEKYTIYAYKYLVCYTFKHFSNCLFYFHIYFDLIRLNEHLTLQFYFCILFILHIYRARVCVCVCHLI